MNEHPEQADDNNDSQIPVWLLTAMRLHRQLLDFSQNSSAENPDELFMARCGTVGKIARLRELRNQIGFLPMPFWEYVDGLAKLAGVARDVILSWGGLTDTTSWDSYAILQMSRLAKTLGLEARETALLLRMSVAQRVGVAPAACLLAARRDPGATLVTKHLEEWEAALSQIELDYSPDDLADCQRIEREVSAAY